MKLCLGENLRNARLQKELTQEQLAEVFGVSPQAISRWENGAAFPDISFLSGIALYFDISVDALLGMDKLRDADALNNIHRRIHALVAARQYLEAITLIKDSLKLYPNNTGLLIELCEVLSQTDSTEEAVAVSEQVLTHTDLSMKARSTVTANLLFLYLRVDRKDDVQRLLQTLPHIWESRELLSAEMFDGDEYDKALKVTVKQLLEFCFEKINSRAARQYGVAPAYIQLGMNAESSVETQVLFDTLREYLSD